MSFFSTSYHHRATIPSAGEELNELDVDFVTKEKQRVHVHDGSLLLSATHKQPAPFQRSDSWISSFTDRDIEEKLSLNLDFMNSADNERYAQSVNALSSYRTIILIAFVATIAISRGIFLILEFSKALESSTGIMASLLVLLVSISLFLVVFIAQIVLLSLKSSAQNASLAYRIANQVIFSAVGGEIVSLLQLLSAIGPGLMLVAVVAFNRRCTTSNRPESCDKVGLDEQTFPSDQLLLTFFLPVCSQVLAKGARKSVVFASWLISVAFVAAAVIHHGEMENIWSIIFGLLFLVVLYENERSQRLFHLKLDSAMQTDQRKLQSTRKKVERLEEEKERHKHELEAQRERAIAELQRDQFRRVLAQVALDLKTPLQAIFMDLEVLADMDGKGVFTKYAVAEHVGCTAGHCGRLTAVAAAPTSSVSLFHNGSTSPAAVTPRSNHQSAIDDTRTTGGGGGGKRDAGGRAGSKEGRGHTMASGVPMRRKSAARIENISVHDVISSLSAACNFLHMAVNRSMDFTKASSNIPLVPSLTVFDLHDVINWPVTCMNQLQSTSPVILEPLASGISDMIVSDKHWLGENLLSLLVNVVKKGNGRAINVRVILTLGVPMRTSSIDENDGITSNILASTSLSSFRATDKMTVQLKSFHNPKKQISSISCSSLNSDSPSLRGSISIKPGGNKRSRGLRTALKHTNTAGGPVLKVIVEDSSTGLSAMERANFFSDELVGRDFAELATPNNIIASRRGGTNLGPYILQKRVEALGGACGVELRADGKTGNVYWFTVPYKPSTVTALHSPASILKSVAEADDVVSEMKKNRQQFRGTLNILLVDDSLTSLKVIRRTLTEVGHKVEVAKDGRQGLDILSEILTNNLTLFGFNSPMENEEDEDTSNHDKDRPLTWTSLGKLSVSPDGVAMAAPASALSVNASVASHTNRIAHKGTLPGDDMIGNDGDGEPPDANDNKKKLPNGTGSGTGADSDVGDPVLSGSQPRTRRNSRISVRSAYREAASKLEGDRHTQSSHDSSVGVSRRTSLESVDMPVRRLSSSSVTAQVAPMFDLVLMDIEMPIMNGIDATMALRKLEGESPTLCRYSALTGTRPPVLIIGMSANSDADSKLLARAAGMDYYIEKPFSLADFQSLVDEVYEDYAEHREYGDELDVHSSAGCHTIGTTVYTDAVGGIGSGSMTPAEMLEYSPRPQLGKYSIETKNSM